MKRYRMVDSTIVTISQGEFTAAVKDGVIDLPDALAQDFLQLGTIAPLDTEYTEKADDGLHDANQRQARHRKQSNNR